MQNIENSPESYESDDYKIIKDNIKSLNPFFENIYSNTKTAYAILHETNNTTLFIKELKKGFSNNGNSIDEKVIDIFLDIYLQYPDNLDDIYFLVNKYSEIINSSIDITVEEKSNIYSALSIAAYSSIYWEQQLENYKNEFDE